MRGTQLQHNMFGMVSYTGNALVGLPKSIVLHLLTNETPSLFCISHGDFGVEGQHTHKSHVSALMIRFCWSQPLRSLGWLDHWIRLIDMSAIVNLQWNPHLKFEIWTPSGCWDVTISPTPVPFQHESTHGRRSSRLLRRDQDLQRCPLTNSSHESPGKVS